MAPVYRFPPMLEEECDNGLHVIWVPDHEQAAMTVAIQFPRGKLLDPDGEEGAAELAVELVQKGIEGQSPEWFSEQLESRGCSVFAETTEEFTLLGCRFLAGFAAEVLPLFWKMVAAPGFAPREHARVRKEMLTALDAELAEPSSLASKHFQVQLLGKDHPFARFPSRASVGKLTIEKIRAAAERIIHPQGATMVIAGDFELDTARRTFRPMLAAWAPARTVVDSEAVGVATAPRGRRVRLVHKGDLTQASLVVGHLMPGEQCEARLEIGLANYILGGGNFSSRLMGEVRSRLGKTYGISSHIGRLRSFGHLLIATSTRNEQVGEMLEVILGVYQRFVQEGVTEAEVAKARGFATGSLVFQLEGIGHVVEKLLWLRLYGRDQSYIENYPHAIAQLDAARVNRAIREYFSSESVAITVVGSRRLVESRLTPFGMVEHRHYRGTTR